MSPVELEGQYPEGTKAETREIFGTKTARRPDVYTVQGYDEASQSELGDEAT